MSETSNKNRSARNCRPAVRMCVAADIERYSRFNNPEAARAQRRFIEALRRTREQAGVAESEIDIQPSGDGQFMVLPPGLDESAALPALIAGLSTALRQVNADLSVHACLRLRVAAHRGLLKPEVGGWVGNSAVSAHRLLDSPALRSELARNPAASYAFMISDVLYRDVVAHGYSGLSPNSFRRTTVRIPAKHFVEQAWIYRPAGG